MKQLRQRLVHTQAAHNSRPENATTIARIQPANISGDDQWALEVDLEPIPVDTRSSTGTDPTRNDPWAFEDDLAADPDDQWALEEDLDADLADQWALNDDIILSEPVVPGNPVPSQFDSDSSLSVVQNRSRVASDGIDELEAPLDPLLQANQDDTTMYPVETWLDVVSLNQQLKTENHRLSLAIQRLEQQQIVKEQEYQARLTSLSAELLQQQLVCQNEKQGHEQAYQQCNSTVQLLRSREAATQNAGRQQVDKLQSELLGLQTDLLVCQRNEGTCQKQKALMSNHFQQEIGKHERMLTEKDITLSDAYQECNNTIALHLQRLDETQHLAILNQTRYNQTIADLTNQLQHQTNRSAQVIRQLRVGKDDLSRQLNSTFSLQNHTLGHLTAAKLALDQIRTNHSNLIQQYEQLKEDLNRTGSTASRLSQDLLRCATTKENLAAKLAVEETNVANLTYATVLLEKVEYQKQECYSDLYDVNVELNATQLKMSEILVKLDQCANYTLRLAPEINNHSR